MRWRWLALLVPLMLLFVVLAPPGPRTAGRSRVEEAVGSPDQGREMAPAARPNVLVITADDMRADDLRWMPHVRRLLAARGLVFRNAFSPDPLCSPARVSFLTGRNTHNHRVLDVIPPYGFESFDDSTSLATVLRSSGYRTALVGKYLNGYGYRPTFHGHHPLPGYVPPGWTQWWGSLDQAMGGAPTRYPGGTYAYFHLTSNVNGHLRSWPGQYTTDVTARQTQSLIRLFGRARPQRPWFIWWTPVAPHHGGPNEPDDPGTTVTSRGRATSWLTPARPEWVKHRFDSVIRHGAGTPLRGTAEGNVSDKPGYLRHLPRLTAREKQAERNVTRQRAEALFVLDVRIGQTLAALRQSGQLSRTIVVFNSDNGYYLGEHRRRQGKTTLHEPSIRVPLIIAGPGIPHGVRYDPASLPDLGVTIAGWGRTSLPKADGIDLGPTIQLGDRGWTRPLVIEGRMWEPRYLAGRSWRRHMRGLNTLGIRTARYVFVRYSTGETELYDLQRDPLQLNNLKGEAAQALRVELTSVWEQYVRCAGDGCRRTLPTDLQLNPAETARITDQQERARRAY